jgi:hypothetical protein
MAMTGFFPTFPEKIGQLGGPIFIWMITRNGGSVNGGAYKWSHRSMYGKNALHSGPKNTPRFMYCKNALHSGPKNTPSLHVLQKYITFGPKAPKPPHVLQICMIFADFCAIP